MSPTLDLPAIQHSELSSAVTELVELQRLQNRLEARRMEVLAQCEARTLEALDETATSSSHALQVRGMHADIGAALHISDTTVARHMTRAVAITSSYPATRRHCHAGRLSFQQASVISDEGSIIEDDERRGKYEDALVDVALTETVGRLRPVAKKLAVEFTDLDLTQQHAEARARRHVRLHDYGDGMAELAAYMPAVEAYAVWDRMTRMAWKVKAAETQPIDTESRSETAESSRNDDDASSEGTSESATADEAKTSTAASEPRSGTTVETEAASANRPKAKTDTHSATEASSRTEDEVRPRSLDEIRTDVFTDLLTAGTPSEELAGIGLGAIQGRVQVTVPKRHLLTNPTHAKPSSGAGHLTGYGPIDLKTTRDLAGHSTTWDEAHIDPMHGTVLTVTSYQPSQAQRRYLRMRDASCRFPGCRAPVTRCDIDHTVAASDGGPTSSTNLAHLCRPHHRMKHHTEWSVKQLPGGIMKWVSPTGRTHYDKPVSRVMFQDVGDGDIRNNDASAIDTEDHGAGKRSLSDPRVTTRVEFARKRESSAQRRRNIEGEAPTARERRARILKKYRPMPSASVTDGDGEADAGAETQPF